MSPKFVRGGARPPAKPGTILQARPYELHGTRYFAVLYRLDAEPEPREARLSFDMIYDDPRPGDAVLVESVLGVVDRMQRREAS
ncbi:MAG: hypothetical protein ACYDEB_10700 [Dehalococcoidia bacterium]